MPVYRSFKDRTYSGKGGFSSRKYVPAGVSIMNYFDVLKHSIVQLVFVCIISTIITFAVTAWSVKLTLRLMKSRKPENLQSGGGEK